MAGSSSSSQERATSIFCSKYDTSLPVQLTDVKRHRARRLSSSQGDSVSSRMSGRSFSRAYYADAIDVTTLKREQYRINAEVAEAESQLAQDGEKLAQAKRIIDLALELAENCAASYRKAKPDVRKM